VSARVVSAITSPAKTTRTRLALRATVIGWLGAGSSMTLALLRLPTILPIRLSKITDFLD